jgi:hypothetical protein
LRRGTQSNSGWMLSVFNDVFFDLIISFGSEDFATEQTHKMKLLNKKNEHQNEQKNFKEFESVFPLKEDPTK